MRFRGQLMRFRKTAVCCKCSVSDIVRADGAAVVTLCCSSPPSASLPLSLSPLSLVPELTISVAVCDCSAPQAWLIVCKNNALWRRGRCQILQYSSVFGHHSSATLSSSVFVCSSHWVRSSSVKRNVLDRAGFTLNRALFRKNVGAPGP